MGSKCAHPAQFPTLQLQYTADKLIADLRPHLAQQFTAGVEALLAVQLFSSYALQLLKLGPGERHELGVPAKVKRALTTVGADDHAIVGAAAGTAALAVEALYAALTRQAGAMARQEALQFAAACWVTIR